MDAHYALKWEVNCYKGMLLSNSVWSASIHCCVSNLWRMTLFSWFRCLSGDWLYTSFNAFCNECWLCVSVYIGDSVSSPWITGFCVFDVDLWNFYFSGHYESDTGGKRGAVRATWWPQMHTNCTQHLALNLLPLILSNFSFPSLLSFFSLFSFSHFHLPPL